MSNNKSDTDKTQSNKNVVLQTNNETQGSQISRSVIAFKNYLKNRAAPAVIRKARKAVNYGVNKLLRRNKKDSSIGKIDVLCLILIL